MKFADIPGKAEIKQNVIDLITNDRLPHALLVVGGEGSGKLAFALALASYVQCENKTSTDSCGTCKACLKTHKYIHPDVHFTYPVGKFGTKARKDVTSNDFLPKWRSTLLNSPYLSLEQWQTVMGDPSSAPNINTQECHDIMHNLGLQSFESEYKIQIIWQAQFLRKEGNRLLKLIEEPTPNTLLILIAEDTDSLLNTIVSRCQQFKMIPFKDDDIKQHFHDKGFGAVSEQVLFLANGNMCQAINFQHGEQTEYSNLVLEWMRVSWQAHPDAVLPFVDKLAALGKDERIFFIQYTVHFFRQYLIYLYTKDHKKIRLLDKEKDTVLKMIKIIDVEKAQQIISKLDSAIELLNRNINAKLMFTNYTLQFGKILKSVAA